MTMAHFIPNAAPATPPPVGGSGAPAAVPVDFDAALDRIRQATGTRTQTELADLLGIRQSSVSDAKRRGSIPAEWLLSLYRSHRINPEWVLTGQGGRYALASDEPEQVVLASSLELAVRQAEAEALARFAHSVGLDQARDIYLSKLPRGAVLRVCYEATGIGTGEACDPGTFPHDAPDGLAQPSETATSPH